MLTREQAVAMARNALDKQAEEYEQKYKEVVKTKDLAMARFRSINKENSVLREHVTEQQVAIARLSSRVRTQDKAISSLRMEVKKKVVHFALRGKGGSSSRPLVADDAENEEASSEELLYY